MRLKDIRILLVEDDPLIALNLRLILEAEGATVIGPAHTLANAFELLANNSIDVAVLDHLIVEGNTLALADELNRRGLGFLFHTSHRGVIPERYPTTPVLDKPTLPDQLVEAVRRLVEKAF
jgi:DNA-binding NarL/FixJ family response regulator